MLETMRKANGTGIAANQVGILKSIAIISDRGLNPLIIANPEIIDSDGHDTMVEGCLSYPNCGGAVTRAAWVHLRYLGEDNQIHEIQTDGFLAKVIQHEVDHLNGMTILQKWNQVDKLRNRKALASLKNIYS